MKTTTLAGALLASAALINVSSSQTVTWDGGAGDGLFGSATNWDGDVTPDFEVDDALIDGAGVVSLGTSLNIGATTDYSTNAIDYGNQGSATLTVTNSTLNVTGQLEMSFSGGLVSSNVVTKLIIGDGGSVTTSSLAWIGVGDAVDANFLPQNADTEIRLDAVGAAITIAGADIRLHEEFTDTDADTLTWIGGGGFQGLWDRGILTVDGLSGPDGLVLADYVDVVGSTATVTAIPMGGTAPDAPTLVAPVDAADPVSLLPTLEWNAAAGAASYGVYLWKTADTALTPADPPTATVAGLTYDVPSILDPLTSYSWFVTAINTSGATASSTWTFTTQDTPPPVPGVLYNVDLYGGDDKGLMSGAAAIGAASDIWNNVQGGFGATTINDLVDAQGNTVVGSSISIDGNSGWSSFAGDGTYGSAEVLMRDYLITAPDITSTVTITVPEADSPYTLYLYGVTNFAPQDTTFTVVGANEGPQTVTSPDTSGPLTVEEDYVVFTGETDGSGMIQIDYTGGSSFSAFDGLQLLIDDAVGPQLRISLNGSNLDFEWDSNAGMLYDLIFSNDLGTAISTWPIVAGQEGIPADGSGTNMLTLPLPTEDKTFYSLNEYPAPPPPPLFSEDFESGDGGFTVATALGTGWAQGTPDSDNDFNLVIDSGNGESTGCFAVGLGTFNSDANRGYYVANSSTILTSPAIDLTGITAASLTFAEAVDFDGGATGEVYVIDGSDAVIGVGPIYTVSGEASADWADANGGTPIALPAAAMGQSVRIEWRFTGGTEVDWLGWYIDDVAVNQD
ncbi:MAG: hypothetical protein AAGB14_05150 [Verrucomicrobiota bacterium]